MEPIIKLVDFRRTYRNGSLEVHAVRGVTLDIFAGEFVAVMGASGSGKSTMMNTIGCLDRPTGGHYYLDGVDVGELSRTELANLRNSKLGFVFQGFNLLSRTSALENVELPLLYVRPPIRARDQREQAMNALEMVSLADRADHYPNQLLGRAAAAGRYRPGFGEPTARAPGGRAYRQPGHPHEHRGDGRLSVAQ